jgi:uncharacterized beta barrel domain-containing protein DUF5777
VPSLLASATVVAALLAAPAAPAQDPTSVKGVEAEDLQSVEPDPARRPSTSDDRAVDPVEPDFVVVNMPTQARMPRGGWAFRVTHRFSRPLGEGSLGDLAKDLFGFDSGGLIGLELRYGVARATQVGLHRTSDRTVQFFGQRDVRRAEDEPFGLAAFAAVDGLDNFTEDYSPGAGLIVSRRLGERGGAYAMPALVAHLVTPGLGGDSEFTTALVVGLGVRFRFSENGALLFEATPRLNAPDSDDGFRHPVSFGIERTLGGHAFQVNISNSFGTTLGQRARGGASRGWYIGFNIARKFY